MSNNTVLWALVRLQRVGEVLDDTGAFSRALVSPSNPTPAKTGRLTVLFIRPVVDNFVRGGELFGCERVRLQKVGEVSDNMDALLRALVRLRKTGEVSENTNALLQALVRLRKTGEVSEDTNALLRAPARLRKTGEVSENTNAVL